jgi:drug/metabolite transporter (DMT)-like permease
MAIHLAYCYLQIATLKLGDLSAVYPISGGTAPMLVAIGAVLFLGETVTPLKWVGLFIIACSIMLFALEGGSEKGGVTRKAVWLALAHGCTVAGYTLIDAAGIRAAEVAVVFMVWFFVFDGSILPTIETIRNRRWLTNMSRRDLVFGLWTGGLSVIGFGAAMYAFRIGVLAELGVLRETSVVFAALIGAIFLGEIFGMRRIIAAAIIVAGIILMRHA